MDQQQQPENPSTVQDSDKPSPKSRLPLIAMAVAIVVIVIIVGFYLSYNPGGPSLPSATTTATTSAATTTTVVQSVSAFMRTIAFDPADGNMYITASVGNQSNSSSLKGYIYIVNGTSIKKTAIGKSPYWLVYNPINRQMYTYELGYYPNIAFNSILYAVNDTNARSLLVPCFVPTKVMYNPSQHAIYLACSQGVSLMQNDSIVSSINLTSPQGFAYDPSNQYFYVAGFTGIVTALKGTSVVSNITINNAATGGGVVYNSKNGYIYVMVNYQGYDQIAIINGTKQIGSISAMQGSSLVGSYGLYDPMNGYVYMVNTATGNMYVVNGTKTAATLTGYTKSPAAGWAPIAYDNATGWVYGITATGVSIINGTSVMTTIPLHGAYTLSYNPINNNLYVLSSNITVISSKSIIATIKPPA